MSGHSQPNLKPSICFVALNSYNLLSGRENISHIGGAEVQQVRIASWLMGRGYPVSFVTLDHGQPDGVNIHGIKVYKAYATEDGIRGLRFVYPRWLGLWAAMARADADVYYQRCAGNETGQVALWCRLHRRKFLFAAANDSDCDSSLYALQSWREKVLYRIGLRLADAVTAQTTTQQRLLRENMGLSTILVRNCGWNLAGCAQCEQPLSNGLGSIRVLWVGRISEQKRFEWLLDVAEKCPEITFDVVGVPNTTCGYASLLTKRATAIPNVRMHGQIPYCEMHGYYQRCSVLCCTSAYEGFPNTFLEAWSLGIPVVSTFDPDGVIAANGLGLVAQDVEGIMACLKKLIQSAEMWSKASKVAKQYYLDNHTPDKCLPKLERLLLRVSR
jgi:glycosyltransferase involved in cell wall biosynthesis